MPPIQPPRLTNIGTTVPPVKVPAVPRPFVPGTGTARPVGLPVAVPEGQDPGPQVVAPNPLWVSRWQPSATVPLSRAPWVTGYRAWRVGVVYQAYGHPLPWNRVDFLWGKQGVRRGYTGVPDEVYFGLLYLQGSVGQFFHRFILPPNWRPGMGALYPEVPANE